MLQLLQHISMKWKKAGDKIKTVQDFIEQIASKSSMTGLDYKIVYSDGKESRQENTFMTN